MSDRVYEVRCTDCRGDDYSVTGIFLSEEDAEQRAKQFTSDAKPCEHCGNIANYYTSSRKLEAPNE